jgi:hypothetical protein
MEHRVIQVVTLNEHTSFAIRAAGPAADLLHELESPFVGPKIRKGQQGVRTENGHKCYRSEIQSFYDHLRAHENIGLPVFHLVKQATQRMFALHRIHVHTRHARIRKCNLYLFFYFLCTIRTRLDAVRTAVNALQWRILVVPAIVAPGMVARFVVGEANGAVRALRHPATGKAD